jgi:tRNA (uracil-5-)-methyltransferase TRM9
MRQDAAARLGEINREFYQTFASAFSSTRRHLQPGVQRALRSIPPASRVLDLGCGSGELARGLARRGFHGTYLGIDSSPAMIDLARERAAFPWVEFEQADIVEDDWAGSRRQRYDRIFLLAALHHVPGDDRRRRLLSGVARTIAASGCLTLSVWRFETSPRWMKRIIPWNTIGLAQDDLDPGDCLLDWRHGGLGLRYVHLFSDEELEALAWNSGFKIVEGYRSDGEGGRMGLYQVWVMQDGSGGNITGFAEPSGSG